MEGTDFKRASHDVWEAMAPGWEEWQAYLEERARVVTEKMLERLEPSAGQTLLDLAAGTGVVGFAAAPLVQPGGRVIVSDFSEAMVEIAVRQAAHLGLENVECRVLDAERIDLPDGSVDGVVCRWGYMLMGDPAAAFGETRRVLRDGGRLSCAVFAGPEDNPWAALPSRLLVERGHMPSPESGAPGILALADTERLTGLITSAGFGEPRLDELAFAFGFDAFDQYWDLLLHAAGAIAMVLERLDEGERAEVRDRLASAVESFGGAGRIEFPAKVHVASAS
jgi:ubiquinone/menaquinone biosynthesis C-methylase UbiE